VEGTDTGHENGEAMASVGVGLTAQLGAIFLAILMIVRRRRSCANMIGVRETMANFVRFQIGQAGPWEFCSARRAPI